MIYHGKKLFMIDEMTKKLRKRFISKSFILVTSVNILISIIILISLLVLFKIDSHSERLFIVRLVAQNSKNDSVRFVYRLSSDAPLKMTKKECQQTTAAMIRVDNPFLNSEGQFFYRYILQYDTSLSQCDFRVEYSTKYTDLKPRKSIRVTLTQENNEQSFLHSLLDK
ncbi:hypothetical protein [Xenorhabdus bovienii]|uniref:hypothetical protein n=1 Tax=Xenorhabdus bovienii TaxID=40576 RepID=UPI003DA45376